MMSGTRVSPRVGATLGGGSRSRHRGFAGVAPRERRQEPSGATALLAVAVFVLALVAGFAWAQDRQLRGGILAQREEAIGRPDWAALPTLPPHVPLAFLVAVDPTFLYRTPLDPGAEGGTLSRQLVRQVHRLGPRLGGQARELVMGPLLEARLSEAELLELYLNRIYLGQDAGWPIFGIHHAAREFFDTAPQELTPGQAATLAGLLLPPRIQEPRAQAGAVGVRRNEVLRQTLAAGAITAEEYAAALQEPLGFQPGPEHAPMTRPAGWDREPEVIRLPPEPVAPPEGPAGGARR